MEVNLNKHSYILPLDSIDLNLLPISRYLNLDTTANEATVPIWRADRKMADDNYYEFEVYAEPILKKDREDSGLDCDENLMKQMCHICNIEVPTAYLKKHCDSDKHKTFNKIIINSMDRLQKHALSEMCVSSQNDSDNHFCSCCCVVVKKGDKKIHKKSILHRINTEYDCRIKLFSNSFILKEETMKNIEVELCNDAETVNNSETKSCLDVEKTEQIENIEGSSKTCLKEMEPVRDRKQDGSTFPNIESKQPVEMIQNKNDLKEQNDLDMEAYLKDIKIENVNLVPHNGIQPEVTLCFADGAQIRVTVDNFLGFHRVDGRLLCRLCGVLVDCEREHLLLTGHLQALQTPLTGVQGIRLLNFEWYGMIWHHCILCNDALENIEVHISGANHVALLKQATITRPSIVQPDTPVVHSKTPSLTGIATRLCRFCNIYLPVGKQGKANRKSHNKSVGHKYKKWLAKSGSKYHYLMEIIKDRSDVVICQVCCVLVTNTKEAIDRHMTTFAHETKYKQLLENNYVTKTDELSGNCSACNTVVMCFEELDHIGSKKHIAKTQIKGTPTATPTAVSTEVNQGIENNNITKTKAAKVSENNANIFENAISNANPDKDKNTVQNEPASFSGVTKKVVPVNNSNEAKNQVAPTKPNVSANFAHWLKFNKFTKTENSNDLYYCNYCQKAMLQQALFDHSNTSCHQTNIKASMTETAAIHDGFYYCEICATRVPNIQTCIDDHIKGKKHQNKAVKYDKKVKKGVPNNTDSSSEISNRVAEKNKITANISKDNVAVASKPEDNNNLNVVQQLQTNKIATSCPSLDKPGTSKDLNGADTDKINLYQSILDISKNGYYFMERKDKQVYCRLCKTYVPDTKTNIDDHFSGKRHIKNRCDILIQNDILISNRASLFCSICSKRVHKSKAFHHIESSEHENAKLATCNLTRGKSESSGKVTKTPQVATTSATMKITRPEDKNVTNHTNVNENSSNFCDLCLVGGLNCEVTRKAHYESLRHKTNLTALKNQPSKFSKLSKKYPFKTIPNSDKVLCQICDQQVLDLKKQLEKHVMKKCHSDRLLAENLNNMTCRLSKENLKNHQIHDHGNNTYHCRLCSVTLDGKWRAEIHILGQQHLKLLEKSIKPGNEPVKATVTESFASNYKDESVEAAFFDALEDEAEVISSSSLFLEPVESDKEEIRSGNSSAVDYWFENENCILCDDEAVGDVDANKKSSKTGLKTEYRGPLLCPAPAVEEFKILEESKHKINVSNSKNEVTSASTIEKEEAAAKDIFIPDGFEKSENPNQLFCQDWKVLVPANNCNIEEHVKGSKHIQSLVNNLAKNPAEKSSEAKITFPFIRDSNNPKQVICTICTNPVTNLAAEIETHLKGLKHNNKLEAIISSNNIERPFTVFNGYYECNLCIALLDETKLIEHLSSSKHIESLCKRRDRELETTDNSFVYFCEFCQKYVHKDNVNDHITHKTHRSKVKETLSKHEIEILTQKNHCTACNIYLDDSVFTHINTESHKINATKITYVGPPKIRKVADCQSKLLKPFEEIAIPTGIKRLITMESITEYDLKTSRIKCIVCKLTFMDREYFNSHLKTDSHITMFEYMFSANRIEDTTDTDYYFCRLCNEKILASIIVQHIQGVHNVRVFSMLPNHEFIKMKYPYCKNQ